MPDRLRQLVLRVFRVPAEPEPPAGDPASLRVFRAAPRYFRYKLIGWALGQLGTLIGLLVGVALGLTFIGRWLEGGLLGTALAALAVLAWFAFLAQVPFSFAALRLDYELRWYMLSDRALRIREGIVSVRERTMTFANIQHIAVRQGPIQRLLGIADIEVRTAGGGASGDEGNSMHRGYFRGVADPESVRDTIRARVERYRDAGLGAPETAGAGSPGRSLPAPPAADPGALQAAREVLDEVRALRAEVTAGR